MISGRFLRFFHSFGYTIYEGLEVLKLNLPMARGLDKDTLTTEHLNLVWHNVIMEVNIFKLLAEVKPKFKGKFFDEILVVKKL